MTDTQPNIVSSENCLTFAQQKEGSAIEAQNQNVHEGSDVKIAIMKEGTGVNLTSTASPQIESTETP